MGYKSLKIGVAVLAGVTLAFAADVDVSKLPPAAKKDVDFAKEIKPLLEKSCVKCHGAEKQKSKYRMDTREALIKGGSSEEAAVVVGESAKSPLVHYVAGLIQDMEMPPLDDREKYPALTPEQIGLLRAWIDQGAKWPDSVKIESPK
jgi:mono/diheme cytochrome c family protein